VPFIPMNDELDIAARVRCLLPALHTRTALLISRRALQQLVIRLGCGRRSLPL
jgi:hypothetical protein